jgi:hypothetical protein
MKQVLDKSQAIYYVDSSDLISFIEANSDMEWNDVCEFVKENDIGPGEYGPAFWEKTDLIKNPKDFNEEQVYWLGAFFDTHPWIDRMMVVFDD